MFPAVGISSTLRGSKVRYNLSSVLVVSPACNLHKEMEIMAGLWDTQVDFGLKWEILERWFVWADVRPGLCSIATFATFNFEMPNPSSVWLLQIPAEERSWAPCCIVSREPNWNGSMLCPVARTWWLWAGRSVGSRPRRDIVPQNVHLSHYDWKQSCLIQSCKGKPNRGLSPGLLLFLMQSFLGCFFLCFSPCASFSRLGEADTPEGRVSRRATGTH